MDLDALAAKIHAFMAKHGPLLDELHALHAEGRLVNPPEKKAQGKAEAKEKTDADDDDEKK